MLAQRGAPGVDGGGDSSVVQVPVTSAPVGGEACTFCGIVAGTVPAQLVLDEGGVVSFLDVRPVFKGHVLVVPRAHRDSLADLAPAELGTVMAAVQRLAAAVGSGLGAGGSWISLNDRVSQSVPHVHVHVVPRTKGDGLRGFFWPRTRYVDDADAAHHAARIRDALGAATSLS
jgi:histidine triad (HIT) family protein